MDPRWAVAAGLLALGFAGCASSYMYTVDGKKYRCSEGGARRTSDVIANCTEIREPGWYRAGATTEELNRDKYECTREAAMVPRVPYPSAPPSVPGSDMAAAFQQGFNSAIYQQGIAAARASEERADELFGMCMNARGWRYRTY